MSGEVRGFFEQAVMLAVIRLGARATGANVLAELCGRLERKITSGAAHITLQRLEGKGFVTSVACPRVPGEGGRARRRYAITASGEKALDSARDRIERAWSPGE